MAALGSKHRREVARDLAIGRHALAFSRQPRERIDVLDAVANRRPLR
jgi:hypothetical protein